jgi:hypothetical protein
MDGRKPWGSLMWTPALSKAEAFAERRARAGRGVNRDR